VGGKVSEFSTQPVNEFRWSVASVAKNASEPINAKLPVCQASRLGDSIGVKQERVASVKLYGGFCESL
jgi:hypothetical protein